MLVTVQQNPTAATGGKKRAAGDLAEYVPGVLDSNGRDKIASLVSVTTTCKSNRF